MEKAEFFSQNAFIKNVFIFFPYVEIAPNTKTSKEKRENQTLFYLLTISYYFLSFICYFNAKAQIKPII